MVSLLVIRAALFPGTGGDDGEQLIFSQYFDWGYQVRNPPLYTWLVIAVAKITGANLWAVNIVKFSLLAAMYLFLWRAGLRLFQTSQMAALAAFSPVLFYFVGWEVITGLSHTVLVTTLYAGTFWAVVRLRAGDGHILDYALLGILFGLGGMAKYAYWIFLTSFLIACLFDRDLRRRLLSPKLAMSVVIAVAVAWPHYAWLAERLAALKAEASSVAATGNRFNIAGLGHTLKAVAGFVLPFFLIALALFPTAFRPGGQNPARTHPMARVIGIQILFVLVCTLIGTLLIAEFRIRTHYMFVLLLLPFWVLLRAEAAPSSQRRIGLYGAMISLVLIAGPIGMLGKYLFEPLLCSRCQHHIPYDDLANQIRAAGFIGGTVIATSHPDPLPGNLRAVLPEARVISVKHPDIIPPLGVGNGQCLSIWSADVDYQRKGDGIALANQRLDAGVTPGIPHKLISIPLDTLWSRATGHFASFGYILLPGTGRCR